MISLKHKAAEGRVPPHDNASPGFRRVQRRKLVGVRPVWICAVEAACNVLAVAVARQEKPRTLPSKTKPIAFLPPHCSMGVEIVNLNMGGQNFLDDAVEGLVFVPIFLQPANTKIRFSRALLSTVLDTAGCGVEMLLYCKSYRSFTN